MQRAASLLFEMLVKGRDAEGAAVRFAADGSVALVLDFEGFREAGLPVGDILHEWKTGYEERSGSPLQWVTALDHG